MKINFHTNLDEPKMDVYDLNTSWPKEMGIPRVGERIRFKLSTGHYELEVHSVSYEPIAELKYERSFIMVYVELHMPSYIIMMGVDEFEKRYIKDRR